MALESVLIAEDWFDNQLQPVWVSKEAILSKAVAVSLLLHGFAFLVLMSVTLRPGKQEDTAPAIREIGITVTLVSSVADPMAGSQTQQVQPVAETTPAPENSSDPAEQAFPVTITEIPAEVPATMRVADEDTPATAETVVTTTADRAATQAFVNTAIADYRTALQTDLNREFVEGCIRQRNRYGPASDCPESFSNDYGNFNEERALVDELFAVLNNDQVNARHSWWLTRENTMLKDMLENVDNTVAAQALTTRLALNTKYLQYLNGNISPDVAAYNVMTGFTNDYARTITPRPYQFECPVFKPCVYKFTGFTVKRPANYVKKTPSFAEQTPLFMPSQD